MSLFVSSKLLMALLGSSCALLGPIRCQNGPQNGAQKWSKRGPKQAPKNDLKNDPKSADFGSQNGPKIGFLGALKTWGAGPFFIKNVSFAEDIRPFLISEKMYFFVFFAFKSQKYQFRRRHSAIFAFPENACFY